MKIPTKLSAWKSHVEFLPKSTKQHQKNQFLAQELDEDHNHHAKRQHFIIQSMRMSGTEVKLTKLQHWQSDKNKLKLYIYMHIKHQDYQLKRQQRVGTLFTITIRNSSFSVVTMECTNFISPLKRAEKCHCRRCCCRRPCLDTWS